MSTKDTVLIKKHRNDLKCILNHMHSFFRKRNFKHSFKSEAIDLLGFRTELL